MMVRMIIEQKLKQTSMNKYWIYFTIVLSILFSNCSNTDYYSSDFLKVKKGFDNSLLTHFPDEVSCEYNYINIFPPLCNEKGRCGSLLVILDSNEILEFIKSSYSPLNISRYEIFIINDNCTHNLAETSKHSWPIPNFNQIIDGCKFCDNIKRIDYTDLTYYFLDSEPGIFIDKKYLSQENNIPAFWKHGYSRGIAFDETENIIFFWLEIW